MRKLLIVFFTIILSGISCKKICACDPVQASLYLVIKDNFGKDLFDPTTPGYYTKDQVWMMAETQFGRHPITFSINPINKRLGNYYLFVNTVASIVSFSPILYLKLGNQEHTLHVTISKDGRKIERLLIDDKNIPSTKKPEFYSLFYYTL